MVGCLDYIIISSAGGVAGSAATATAIRLYCKGRVGSELDKSGLTDGVRSCRDNRVWSIPKPISLEIPTRGSFGNSAHNAMYGRSRTQQVKVVK